MKFKKIITISLAAAMAMTATVSAAAAELTEIREKIRMAVNNSAGLPAAERNTEHRAGFPIRNGTEFPVDKRLDLP